MLPRLALPDPVYVAVVRSITGLLPSKLVGILVVLAQAAFVSYQLGDVFVAAASVFTAVVAVPRVVVLALWSRHRLTVVDAGTAARWETALLVANLPTAFGIGLVAAATIAHGDPAWSMVEAAVAVGFVSTYIAAAGVRPAVGTAHFLAVMVPGLVACLFMGGAPYLLLAGLSALLVQTWREYQRAAHTALVSQITLEQNAAATARLDPLTGLGNRLAYSEHLRALSAAGQAFTLLLVDLDGFKQVNDGFGHSAGDAVLSAIAGRLQGRLRPGEAAFRLGGDEFAILATRAVGDDLPAALLRDCAAPLYHHGRALRVGGSIGVAHGPDPLVERRADDALYVAKADGKNCWRRSAPLPLAA